MMCVVIPLSTQLYRINPVHGIVHTCLLVGQCDNPCKLGMCALATNFHTLRLCGNVSKYYLSFMSAVTHY